MWLLATQGMIEDSWSGPEIQVGIRRSSRPRKIFLGGGSPKKVISLYHNFLRGENPHTMHGVILSSRSIIPNLRKTDKREEKRRNAKKDRCGSWPPLNGQGMFEDSWSGPEIQVGIQRASRPRKIFLGGGLRKKSNHHTITFFVVKIHIPCMVSFCHPGPKSQI